MYRSFDLFHSIPPQEYPPYTYIQNETGKNFALLERNSIQYRWLVIPFDQTRYLLTLYFYIWYDLKSCVDAIVPFHFLHDCNKVFPVSKKKSTI